MPKPPACPDKVNVLLIGGGGREHALGWKIKKLGDWANGSMLPSTVASHRLRVLPDFNLGPFHEKSNNLSARDGATKTTSTWLSSEVPLAEGIHDAVANDTRLLWTIGRWSAARGRQGLCQTVDAVRECPHCRRSHVHDPRRRRIRPGQEEPA